MHPTLPLTRDLVLVGGGHAHALVLRRWGMKPLPGVRLTLISPEPSAPYTGMLPGLVAGHYRRDALEIDLVRLARFAGARLVLGKAEALDRAARRITVPGRPPIAYDIASIDIGASSDMPDLPGFAELGVAAKPLGPFVDAWEAFLAEVAAGRKPPRVAVIGAGIAGVELALAMEYRLRAEGAEDPQVTVLEARSALRDIGPPARGAVRAALEARGIAVRTGTTVTGVGPDTATLGDGTEIPSAFTVGAAGVRPQGWLAETGLDLADGWIEVDETLRSPTDPTIFAAGDCAHLAQAPRPKAGVFAVRAAPVLSHNLRAALSGGRMRAFRPQEDYLKLISLGRRSAVADKYRRHLAGPFVWRLKDRIDRRFMRRFADLPPMTQKLPRGPLAEGVREEIGDKPLCGGCGAKIGPEALAAALAGLPAPARPDVTALPGDDAALLTVGGQAQLVTTDHLRAVTEDPWLQARIAAVHAMGDIWAMAAEPQAALATIILPRMSEGLQRETLREIMDAAGAVFRDAGAEVVGGHSSMGAELTIGFTVTGLAAAAPVTLAGAKPGDRLILTKPIGTGTVLAAEMAGAARGAWVAAAWESMAAPSGAAADTLRDAHAMTDVTGFGLAGHLLNILKASGVAARLDLGAVPLLAGAAELARRGVRSSLYAANAALGQGMGLPDTPEAALLFDPQTAGGLLAAVAPDVAPARLDALRARGAQAAIIGEIVAGAPSLRLG